jgi:hypothetical protein
MLSGAAGRWAADWLSECCDLVSLVLGGIGIGQSGITIGGKSREWRRNEFLSRSRRPGLRIAREPAVGSVADVRRGGSARGLRITWTLQRRSEPATTDSKAKVTTPEHAVLVHLKNTNLDGVIAIEDSLEPAIAEAGVGEYDGNEVAVDGSEAILYAYGPDADALWNVMRPIVLKANPPDGSYVIKRYGEASDPTAREVRVELAG